MSMEEMGDPFGKRNPTGENARIAFKNALLERRAAMKKYMQSRQSKHVLAAVICINLILLAFHVAAIEGQPSGYDNYAAVLGSYVDNRGMVDYAALKALSPFIKILRASRHG